MSLYGTAFGSHGAAPPVKTSKRRLRRFEKLDSAEESISAITFADRGPTRSDYSRLTHDDDGIRLGRIYGTCQRF